MKISDLCNQIKKYSRKDLEWLTVELYEAVPKTKKEDIGIDEMITNPSYRKKKETKAFTLAIIQAEITKFIANAEAQHYLIPNREVPKSERSKWRFRVKQWYKDLQREKLPGADLAKQAELLTQLYHLLCKACGYQLFTAYDPFQSVGVEQTAFYETILRLKWEVDEKPSFVKSGISLIVDNFLNRYTLYSDLMEVLLSFLTIADLRYLAIETAQALLAENGFRAPAPEKECHRVIVMFDRTSLRKQEKHNNLVEMIFRTHAKLLSLSGE